MAEIVLISGEIQSGKTTFCLDLYHQALERKIQVGGLISPAVFVEDQKIAIDVLDLSSGEQIRLAVLNEGRNHLVETKNWSFFPDSIEWGNQRLKEAVPCQLLIVDELGPLELVRNQGWVEGIKAVESRNFQTAVIVIRPSLLDEALMRWSGSRVIHLDPTDNSILADQLLDSLTLE